MGFFIFMQPSTATTSGQALTNLQAFQGTQQTPQQELQTADQNLGVNQAQQQVQGLQGAITNTTNLLNQVAPSVEGRTQNSLVTAAQAGKQISNEEAPIQSNLSQDEQGYNTANSNYTNLESQAEDQANANEQGQTNQLSYLQNVYNDLYTQEQNSAQAQTQQQQFAQQLAEQEREANISSDTSSGVGSTLASLLGSQSSPTTASTSKASATPTNNLTGGKSLSDAATALKSLLATNNSSVIRNTLSAIEASAKNGNTYDQAKLQLINTQPEFGQYLANSNGATF